jgi:hypothetical protein
MRLATGVIGGHGQACCGRRCAKEAICGGIGGEQKSRYLIGKAGFANSLGTGQHPSMMHPVPIEGLQYLRASAVMSE